MTRKFISAVLLVVSLVLTGILIVGSFVNYGESISSTDMQNMYLTRITQFGATILLLQLACLVLLIMDTWRTKTV